MASKKNTTTPDPVDPSLDPSEAVGMPVGKPVEAPQTRTISVQTGKFEEALHPEAEGWHPCHHHQWQLWWMADPDEEGQFLVHYGDLEGVVKTKDLDSTIARWHKEGIKG